MTILRGGAHHRRSGGGWTACAPTLLWWQSWDDSSSIAMQFFMQQQFLFLPSGRRFLLLCTFLKLFSWCPSPLLQPPHLVSLEGENKLESVQQRRKEKQDLKKKHNPCWLILCRIMILKKKRWGLVTVCSGEVSVAISCWYWTPWLLCSHWLVMGSNTFLCYFTKRKFIWD